MIDQLYLADVNYDCPILHIIEDKSGKIAINKASPILNDNMPGICEISRYDDVNVIQDVMYWIRHSDIYKNSKK